jgi:hypothetical protein
MELTVFLLAVDLVRNGFLGSSKSFAWQHVTRQHPESSTIVARDHLSLQTVVAK